MDACLKSRIVSTSKLHCRQLSSYAIFYINFLFEILVSECQNLHVVLKNNILIQQGDLKGTYQKSQMINGRNSWKTASSAIWYSSKIKDWVIGSLENIGTSVFIFTVLGDISITLYTSITVLTPQFVLNTGEKYF